MVNMDKEKIKAIIKIWKNSIDIENLKELEKDIQMPFEDLVFDMISGIYTEYYLLINDIPKETDDYDKYIFSEQNGSYSLETFLINRLLRNIRIIKYQDQSSKIIQCSEYNHIDSSIILDSYRLKNQITDVCVKRKIVAHELLHGMKAQFINDSYFSFEPYYKMKEEMKKLWPNEINNFSKNQKPRTDVLNTAYNHNGLRYDSFTTRKDAYLSKFDSNNLDEIYTELDAINYSKDDKKELAILKEGIYIVIKNRESSNCAITNYAYFLEQLVDKKTKFIGLYLDPKYLFEYLNKLYSKTFQGCYSSDKSFMEIFTEELEMIKKNPKNINSHVRLQNALYKCLDVKYLYKGRNDHFREKNVKAFANNGLLEIIDDKLIPLEGLEYLEEFESNRGYKRG